MTTARQVEKALREVRRICLSLPETTERISHGSPLVETEPERFFRPPHVGHRGWLGVDLGSSPDWDELEAILTDAYHHVAPKTLVARLDTEPT